MDTAQWPEGIGVVKRRPMEGNSGGAVNIDHQIQRDIISTSTNKPITTSTTTTTTAPSQQKPQALNCPRCNSAHTKFCYYNNYSLSQPRYFCKTCRRYWTEGGSLRNVPVGGGSRKNKRSSSYNSSSPSSLMSKIKSPQINSQNPNKIFHEGQDLNLAYPPTAPTTYNINGGSIISEFVEFPSTSTATTTTSTISHHSNISELLKSGIGGRGFSSFMSMIPVSDSNNINIDHSTSSTTVYNTSSGIIGLPFQEFSKPSGLDFSLHHQQHHGFGSSQGVNQDNSTSTHNAKLFFPFEDLKVQQPVNSSSNVHELMEQDRVTHHHHHQGDHHHQSNGFWNGSGGGGGGGAW